MLVNFRLLLVKSIIAKDSLLEIGQIKSHIELTLI